MATEGIDPTPLAEPAYLHGLPSPYYTESHRKFQQRCRAFCWEHLISHCMDWEREGDVPEHVFETFSKHGMLLPNLPSPLPVQWLKRLGMHEILGVKVEDWDYVHTGIYVDEMSRSGLRGPPASLTAGLAYGVPPIIKFGSPELQERFLPDLLTGKKRACVAITEPEAGSDVSNITTTAVKSEDGKHYIVNGTKKWITNGLWSDVTTMCVRTGPPNSGAAGLSMLIVPLKNHPGVSMRRMHVSGHATSGTTFITLDNVLVPTSNLVGSEGHGMQYFMTNFNHERLIIAIAVTRQARVALSSALSYTLKRTAFHHPLIAQPVVRHRLAKCAAELETLQAWLDRFLYQLNTLSKASADAQLGGLTALAKAKAGMVFNECAQTAVLLFGGNGYTRTGQGEIVERIYRDVFGARIPGGSEDVMLDLAVRQLVKNFRAQTAEKEKKKKGERAAKI